MSVLEYKLLLWSLEIVILYLAIWGMEYDRDKHGESDGFGRLSPHCLIMFVMFAGLIIMRSGWGAAVDICISFIVIGVFKAILSEDHFEVIRCKVIIPLAFISSITYVFVLIILSPYQARPWA